MERGLTGDDGTGCFESHDTIDTEGSIIQTQADATLRNLTSQTTMADSHNSSQMQDGQVDNLARDSLAASALVQLHGQNQNDNQSFGVGRSSNENTSMSRAPSMTNFYDNTRQLQNRPHTQIQQQSWSHGNIAFPSANTMLCHSDASVRDTISSLSTTITSMQQQQAFMANALGNLTTIIQDIRTGPQPQNVNAQNSSQGNGQVQASHSTDYCTNPVGYENSTFQEPREQRSQNRARSPYGQGDAGNLQPIGRNNVTQQYEWADRGTLSNPADHLQRGEAETRNLRQPRSFEEYEEQRWSEDRPLPHTFRDRQFRRRQQVNQASNYPYSEVKLPPFNGKEEWKVWINRFESVAKRRNWDNDTKLDYLLPRLQGRAGDFVFNQLSEEEISCYSTLVKELTSRFHTIETEKTFAAKFSQRMQKHDETAEEYAAELKRLYSKAYKSRDSKTRQEDLVRRFLDGLKDHEARFEVEYHKEPEDIDEAVYHVVNFIQTRRRNHTDSYADRKGKRFIRRTSHDSDTEESEVEPQDDTSDFEYVMRVPTKGDSYQKKSQVSGKKADTTLSKSSAEASSMIELKNMMKALTDKVEELQKRNTQVTNQQQQATAAGNGGSGVLCYACNQRGHIARNCPDKQRVQSTSGTGSGQPPNQGRTDSRGGRRENPLN